ncbi:MAG: DedA family protein, partial [Mesorhizobium sp.]
MTEAIHRLIEQYGLIAVFLGCVAEGESAAILGGFFAHQHIFVLWQAFLAAFLGAFAGDAAFFTLGRSFADHPYVVRLRRRPGFRRAYRLLNTHPNIFVLTNRYIYGMRLVGGIAAGLSTVSVPRFVILNAISSAVWAA